MSRRLATGTARDLVQAERDIRAFNAGEALVSAGLTDEEKTTLAALLRKIIRTTESD